MSEKTTHKGNNDERGKWRFWKKKLVYYWVTSWRFWIEEGPESKYFRVHNFKEDKHVVLMNFFPTKGNPSRYVYISSACHLSNSVWNYQFNVCSPIFVLDKHKRTNTGRNSSEQGGSPLPPPKICNKRCNRRHVMRRFCLSDFGELRHCYLGLNHLLWKLIRLCSIFFMLLMHHSIRSFNIPHRQPTGIWPSSVPGMGDLNLFWLGWGIWIGSFMSLQRDTSVISSDMEVFKGRQFALRANCSEEKIYKV